jgi:hypothetical protein
MCLELPRFEELSNEQKHAFQLVGDDTYLVTGPPGTGKSVIALFRAASLQRIGKGRQPALLTFSKLLTTWTAQASTFGTTVIRSVAFANGLWVAGGESGQLRTSIDAVTWVTRTSQFGATTINSVAFGDGLWVAGGSFGQLRTSTDAITWVTQTRTFGSSTIYSVAFASGLWVAGGSGGHIRTCTNAVNWVVYVPKYSTTLPAIESPSG